MFRKAERKQTKLKIGFSAPSGAGKTYSALLVAFGMCGDWSKIAVIDTENGSAELYSDLGEYSVCPITPPFTPNKYIQAIQEAVDLGFEVLIVDSLSHAWSGEGGLLEMKDKAAKSSKSANSFTAWRDVTPEHNRLVNAILQSNIDVIVTTRAKSDYVIASEGDRNTVKKVGLAPVFREGLEFELTAFFDLSQDHVATASKDRTKLFDGINFVPTIDTGKKLVEWRNSGAAVVLATQEQKDALAALGSKIEDVAKYFKVSVENLTYDQAQWAIGEKMKRCEATPNQENKSTPPQSKSTADKGTVTEKPIRLLQIEHIIKDSSFTVDKVNEWISQRWGIKVISFDEFSEFEFNDILDALEEEVKKGNAADGNS